MLPVNPAVVTTDSGTWSVLTRPNGSSTVVTGAVARLPRDPTIGALAYRKSSSLLRMDLTRERNAPAVQMHQLVDSDSGSTHSF